MNRTFVVLVIAVGVWYGVKEWSRVHKAKTDLSAFVDKQLYSVDEHSMDTVRQTVIAEASKLGIKLIPADITINYDDTSIQSVAQSIVGKRLGAEYKNKRVAIVVHYNARLAGFAVAQTISNVVIRQIEAPVMPPSKAAQELLDSN